MRTILSLLLLCSLALGQEIISPSVSSTGTVTATTLAPVQGCTDTSVSANTITCSLTPAIAAYTAKLAVDVLLANSVTGATTIAINGLTGKAVTYNGTNPLVTGVMLAGGTYRHDARHQRIRSVVGDRF